MNNREGAHTMTRHSGAPRSGESGIHIPGAGVMDPGSSLRSAPE